MYGFHDTDYDIYIYIGLSYLTGFKQNNIMNHKIIQNYIFTQLIYLPKLLKSAVIGIKSLGGFTGNLP